MSTQGLIKLHKDEALKLYFQLKESLESQCDCKVYYAGSLLRYSDLPTDKEFGDLDLVIVYESPYHTDSIKEFVNKNFEVKRCGSKKITFLKDGMQVDLNATDEVGFESMMLTCTGDSKFNLILRSKAKKCGFKLNEYGLYTYEGELVAINQDEIFEKLGIRYYLPEERSFKDKNIYWLEKRK